MVLASDIWDFIVVGGGLAGSVVTSRLYEYDTSLKILLIEAGPDVSNNTIIPFAANAFSVIGSDLDWSYSTVAQPHLNNRTIDLPAGKALGGGTAINTCGWVRGDQKDYDEWGSIVGDERWSYAGLLPYIKKTEHHYNVTLTPELIAEHGFTGPVWEASVSSTGRNYPLRNPIKDAWAAVGIPLNPDGNSGSPQGLDELNENRKNGLRQLSSTVYKTTKLPGVTVLVNTTVAKLLISTSRGVNTAHGVQLTDGTQFTASREIILSAGAYRTPQLLKLSGIGSKAELASHGIKTIVNNPAVGANLWDHLDLPLYWELSEKAQAAGVAIGSSNPLFEEPQFGLGVPLDWSALLTVPIAGLKAAMTADAGGVAPKANNPLLQNRTFVEVLNLYVSENAANPVLIPDGSHIGANIVGMLPTSRGTVTLASTNIADYPVIDNNFFSTEVDKYVYRNALRLTAQAYLGAQFDGSSLIVNQTLPAGITAAATATDAELDAYVAGFVGTTYHPAGTAAMGTVVDTDLNVIGVSGLRVVDTSVFPAPFTGHLQVPTYALAEQAAEIIAASC